MIAILLYLAALFLLGVGNAVIAYHILRYRDPDDISLTVLIFYFAVIVLILLGTLLFVDWQELLNRMPFSF